MRSSPTRKQIGLAQIGWMVSCEIGLAGGEVNRPVSVPPCRFQKDEENWIRKTVRRAFWAASIVRWRIRPSSI